MTRSKIIKPILYEFPEEDYLDDSNYLSLKKKFSLDYLKSIENNDHKIQNFYHLVLPSLAIQIVVKRISPHPRYVCRFGECDYDGVSFVNKQIYIRHLLTKHEDDLPGSGSFLTNSKYFQKGGFHCSICSAWFPRLDNLNIHALRCKVKNCDDLGKSSSEINSGKI